MHYFERLGDSRFRATPHTQGAWNPTEQHIAPSLGLLAHAVERDRDNRRDDRLPVTRLSYDILGTVPVAEVDVAVRVLRPGRSIELVEATMSHGRAAAGAAGVADATLPDRRSGGFRAAVDTRCPRDARLGDRTARYRQRAGRARRTRRGELPQYRPDRAPVRRTQRRLLGFDTTVSFSADGLGLTHSIIHNETGPIGASSQMLTVRPVR